MPDSVAFMPIDITTPPDPASFELLQRYFDRLLFEGLCAIAQGDDFYGTGLAATGSCAEDAGDAEEYQRLGDPIDGEHDESDLMIAAFRRAWQGESLAVVVEEVGIEPESAQLVEAALVTCLIRRAIVRAALARVDGDTEAEAAAEAELAAAEAGLEAVLPVYARLAV